MLTVGKHLLFQMISVDASPVLTAVGLLPIASGADIKALMEGANAARKDYTSDKISENEAYQYAAVRNILYRKGYTTGSW